LVKISILWFYYTLFAVKAGRVIKIAGALCLAWFIAVTLLLIFQCKPISAFWTHLAQEPYCMDGPHVYLGYELSNLLIDMIILCIPIGCISFSQMEAIKKISVIGIFLLGAL
jgi:hypothetical protein